MLQRVVSEVNVPIIVGGVDSVWTGVDMSSPILLRLVQIPKSVSVGFGRMITITIMKVNLYSVS